MKHDDVERRPKPYIPPMSRDYSRINWRYANDVVAEKIVACKWVKLACQRAIDDRAKQKGGPYIFKKDEAANICGFIETLPHVEGVWDSPTIRLEPWQIFILSQVFGWRVRGSGYRRFSDCYIEVARKNGKSALTSGVVLFGCVFEGEKGPQVKCAATTGDQARIVFDVASKMVDAMPDLREYAGLETQKNFIVCEANGGNIKPINSKASTQDGLNPHLTVIDELHAHANRGLFDVLKSARGARRNPLSWYITTAGYNLYGVCTEQRSIITRTLEGLIESDHYFGIIYTVDDDDDRFDEKNWIKANPNLGVSKHLHVMRTAAKDAQNSPASETEFRTKDCNEWLASASRWLNLAKWDACTDATTTLEDMAGQECWIGGDLGEYDDNTAIGFVFPDGARWRLFVRYYHPREVVQKNADRNGAPMMQWAREGWITLTEGSITDLDHIERDLLDKYMPMFHVRSLTFDKQGSRDLVTRLYNLGYDAGQLQKSAAQISDTAKEFEARINSGLLAHEDNPVLRWNVANCCIRAHVSETILPQKDGPMSPNKIDGIDALLNAAKRMGDDNVEEQPGMMVV